MTVIEKENGQIFEIHNNRKEFINMVKDLYWSEENIWTDEDSSLTLVYKDGTSINYSIGDKKRPLRLNKITKGHYNNPGSDAIYNCKIVYNSHYNDYDVVID